MKARRFSPILLPYLAASAQAIQFCVAGYLLTGWKGLLTGLAVGVTLSFSMAIAAARISDISARRRGLAYVFGVVLLALSPAAIAPITYNSFTSLTGWPRLVAAIAWAIIPDGAIILAGAITGSGFVAREEKPAAVAQSVAQVAPAAKRVAQRAAQGSRPSLRAAVPIPCKYAANGCPRDFPSQNAANAHAARCKFAPVPIPHEWEPKE